MTTAPNHHEPVDFHANLSFFDAHAERIEVEHLDVDHPRLASQQARVCELMIHVAGFDSMIVTMDERTSVSFCQAILAGFDHPDQPRHQGVRQAEAFTSALRDLNYAGDAIDLGNALASMFQQWGLELHRTEGTT